MTVPQDQPITLARILADIEVTPAQAYAFLDWFSETFAHENAYVNLHAKFKNKAFEYIGQDPPFSDVV